MDKVVLVHLTSGLDPADKEALHLVVRVLVQLVLVLHLVQAAKAKWEAVVSSAAVLLELARQLLVALLQTQVRIIMLLWEVVYR